MIRGTTVQDVACYFGRKWKTPTSAVLSIDLRPSRHEVFILHCIYCMYHIICSEYSHHPSFSPLTAHRPPGHWTVKTFSEKNVKSLFSWIWSWGHIFYWVSKYYRLQLICEDQMFCHRVRIHFSSRTAQEPYVFLWECAKRANILL